MTLLGYYAKGEKVRGTANKKGRNGNGVCVGATWYLCWEKFTAPQGWKMGRMCAFSCTAFSLTRRVKEEQRRQDATRSKLCGFAQSWCIPGLTVVVVYADHPSAAFSNPLADESLSAFSDCQAGRPA